MSCFVSPSVPYLHLAQPLAIALLRGVWFLWWVECLSPAIMSGFNLLHLITKSQPRALRSCSLPSGPLTGCHVSAVLCLSIRLTLGWCVSMSLLSDFFVCSEWCDWSSQGGVNNARELKIWNNSKQSWLLVTSDLQWISKLLGIVIIHLNAKKQTNYDLTSCLSKLNNWLDYAAGECPYRCWILD